MSVQLPQQCGFNGCNRPAVPLGLYIITTGGGVTFISTCKIHTAKLTECIDMIVPPEIN